jgi:hypothetical protein
MLGSHPELYAFPELTLFEQPSVGARLAAPPHPDVRPDAPWNPVAGPQRALAQLHDGRQDEPSLARARAWLDERRDWTGAAVLDHLLRLVGPREGVENSPGTSSSEEALARAAEAYPHGRFLHLTRHPATTQRSLRHAYWLYGREEAGARGWLTYHRRIASFCVGLAPERTLRVRGEDVLNDGGPSLRRLCAWLGVRGDEEALDAMRHPERSPYATPGGGADAGFLADPVPRSVELPPELDVPERWAVPRALRDEVAGLAVALGY